MRHRLRIAVLALVTVLVPNRSGAQDTIAVAADGKGQHRTIQDAVDAAPEGAVITIAQGVYEETLAIRKPLTLRGAGWQETVITSPAAANVLVVRGAKGVVIEGVKVVSQAPWHKDGFGTGSVVTVTDAELDVQHCVVCGGPGNGISASDGSALVVRNCLIALVGGTGILACQGRDGRVYVVDSELRACKYAGVQIAKGSNTTTIERCRISGAKWHGIRYDNCAPQIVSNVFFGNERTAIYASGKTQATVLLNLFLGQRLTCWLQNQDTISSNTFVGQKAGVAVLRGSRPRIRRNIFHGNRVAIWVSDIASEWEGTRAEGTRIATENLFWKNEKDFELTGGVTLGDPFSTKAGNAKLDPLFVNPAQKVFALAEDSPARKRSVGAVKHIPIASPWPLQAEEVALQREREEVARKAAERAAEMAAARKIAAEVGRGHQMAQKWIRAVRQTESGTLRQRGVAEIRKGLAGAKRAHQNAALLTIVGTVDIDFDRTGMRKMVEGLAKTGVEELRLSALMALLAFGCRPEDVDRLAEALKECESDLLQSVAHKLPLRDRRRITKQVEKLFLALLETDDDLRRRVGLSALGGKHITPAIEKRCLEMCKSSRRVRDQVIHFVLGDLPVKSKPVIDELLEVAAKGGKHHAKPDYHSLRSGIPEDQRERVVQFLIDIFPSRSVAGRHGCLSVLEMHADKSHFNAITKMGMNTPVLSDPVKQRIGRLLVRIRNRAR